MRILTGLGLAATVFAAVTVASPASAEFFGCNERTSTRVYTTKPSKQSSSHYTHTYSAQSRTYYRAGTTPPRRYSSSASHRWSDGSRW